MGRYVLLDWLRFLAICLMIIFHLIFDLAYFYEYNIEYSQGFWDIWRRVCASLFLFVSGWTASLVEFKWRRLLKLAVASALISLVTYLILPDSYIRFGILHLLLSVNLLYYFLLKRFTAPALLALAGVSYLAYVVVQPEQIIVTQDYWLWLDLTSAGYQTVDHYPLWPWLSIFLVGCYLGRTTTTLLSPYLRLVPRNGIVTYISRQSLIIYLGHQVLLLSLLAMILGSP